MAYAIHVLLAQTLMEATPRQVTRRALGLEPDLLFLSTHEHPLYPLTGAVDAERDHDGAVRGFVLQRGTDSDAWKRVYEQRVLPCLAGFAPELVIISAGFDAHKRDPLANCELEASDFEWVTREIVRCSGGGRAGERPLLLPRTIDVRGGWDWNLPM